MHIHLVKLGEDWKEMVGFRDYLLKHPKVIGRYVRIKKEAVKKARGEGDVYRKHKEKFIKSITTKALTRKMKISKQNKNKFERMVEEATIDCYNEYEQCSGWACTLEEELPLPLKCLIFGEEATLVDVGADEHGTAVLGVITKNKKKIRIPIQDVEAIDKIAKNLEWLKAYRYWIKNG